MRPPLAIVVLFGLVAAIFVIHRATRMDATDFLAQPVIDPATRAASIARGTRDGLEAAERDLARGTPFLRRRLDHWGIDLGADGIGIDA